MRSSSMWLVSTCLLASSLALTAHAAPLSGSYSTPLGMVDVTEKDGMVIARLADANNVCGRSKGSPVFEGNRLDDSIVGAVHACKAGGGTCSGKVDGDAMLLITRNGNTLSGAVHFDAGGCKTPVGGDSIVMRRGAKAQPAQPAPAVAPKPKPESPRARAQKLATEAQAILNGNDGNAEAARAKFQEAVTIDPTYSEGYVGLGVTFFVRDRFDEALEQYKKALEANPGNPDPYYNMACVYSVKGDVEQALRYLRIALLNGFVQLKTIAADPDLKNLAGNPAFEKLKGGDFN